jgi:tRNA 2-selenouridine synthase
VKPIEVSASLLLENPRWIDVRAPVEFGAGAVPGAVNLPLLTDEERHQIGIVYKQSGQAAAVELGHRLVGGVVKEARVQAWLQAAPAVIYCFRGGLRSQITQSWLLEQGVDLPIVAGGYKALRQCLMAALEDGARSLNFEVVCGPTGSGKTEYLRASGRPFVDLEELAAHRGSVFGAMDRPQPTQINFENALALELLRRLRDGNGPVLIENESRLVGRRVIPPMLFEKILSSPKFHLQVPLDTRVGNILRDYVLDSSLGRTGDLGKFSEFRRSVTAISRKLGGLRAKEILADLDRSEAEFIEGRGLDSNRVWIEKLLVWYYDPLY